MEMLPVDIEQHLAEVFQLLDGGRIAVDECPRAAVRADNAAQQAGIVLVESLVLQPAAHGRQGSDVEFGAELGPLRPVANELTAAPVSQDESHGIDEDGLARASLTGEDRHAGTELYVDLVDDREIPDLQARQHDLSRRASRIRLSRPHSSLERRIS